MIKSLGLLALLLSLSCAKGHSSAADAGGDAGTDAGPLAGAPPDATWSYAFSANLYTRALDISCAPADAQAGVEGCIALIRYMGELDGDAGLPVSATQWGSVVFLRTDAAGKTIWEQTLLSGFDPIDSQPGSFVDDDFRVRMLATGEFLVSGTYEGRIFAGAGSNNQALGPTTNRNLFVIEFHADGTFDNWEDTGNGMELRGISSLELPNTNLVIAGSCQGDVPLDTGSFPCGNQTSGYLLTTHYDGSTVGGIAFGGTPSSPLGVAPRPTSVADLAADDSNDLFVSGTFERDFTYGTLAQDIGAGEDDGFLMKLGPDGTRAWMLTAGSLGHDCGGRLARVSTGVLWTALVSQGANVGGTVFTNSGHIVSLVSDSGAVSWTFPVPGAHGSVPLGVTAASDGSFALYGDGYLAHYSAAGALQWERSDADARGAAFTSTSLVVVADAVGTKVFDVSVAASGGDVPRAAVVAFPR